MHRLSAQVGGHQGITDILDGDLRTTGLGAEVGALISDGDSWHSVLCGTARVSPEGRHAPPRTELGLPSARSDGEGEGPVGRGQLPLQAWALKGIFSQSGAAYEQVEVEAVHLANEMQAEYWSVSAKTGEWERGQLWEVPTFPSSGLSSAHSTAICAGDYTGPSPA